MKCSYKGGIFSLNLLRKDMDINIQDIILISHDVMSKNGKPRNSLLLFVLDFDAGIFHQKQCNSYKKAHTCMT